MKEAIGLDIGSTRTKTADLGAGQTGIDFGNFDHMDDRPFTAVSAESMLHLHSNMGYTRIGLTGAGAATFAEAAKAFPECAISMHGSDAFDREIFMQAAGIQSLCRRQGEPLPESFMLVTIGTGVSYTRISGRGYNTFPIGNPLGGGYIVGKSRMAPKDIAEFGQTHVHGDLLMKDRFPEFTGTARGEFVLACSGNMGHDSLLKTASSANKDVATMVVRDLMMMAALMPDWKFSGPIVFAGTPIDEYALLRGWLTYYCDMLGLPHRYVENSAFAGALGAYELACAANP